MRNSSEPTDHQGQRREARVRAAPQVRPYSQTRGLTTTNTQDWLVTASTYIKIKMMKNIKKTETQIIQAIEAKRSKSLSHKFSHEAC